MVRGIVFLLVIFTVTFSTVQGGEDDNGSSLPGQIAYIGTDGNVYTLALEDNAVTALTNDATPTRRYQWPTWAADGRLAYFCCEPLSGESVRVEAYISPDGIEPGILAYDVFGEVFYHAYWSPANCDTSPGCRDLAILIDRLEDIELKIEVVRAAGDTFDSTTIGTGQPFYYSWSPDGRQMLWQRGNLLFDVYDLESAQTRRLDPAPGFIQAPSWSPTDGRLLFGVLNEEANGTDLIILDGENVLTLTDDLEGLVSASWSPDGDFVAFRFIGQERASPLYIADANTGEILTQSSIEGVIAFQWSPDSKRVAYVTLPNARGSFNASRGVRVAQQQPITLVWSVLDVKDGTERRYSEFVPTREMLYFFEFFDQFSQSHRLWSPDSTHLVFAEVAPNGQPVLTVLDMTQADAVPLSIAEGVIGIWSFD